MKGKLTILFIMLFSLKMGITQTKNVKIIGKAPGFQNERIILFTYSDLVSFHEKVLAEGSIDHNGNFKIEARVNETTYTFLKIINVQASLYLEPGKEYRISLIPKDELTGGHESRLYAAFPIETVPMFNEKDSNDLNMLIQDFNYLYNVFLYTNINQLLGGRKKDLVDSAKTANQAHFSKYNIAYLTNYIDYRFAALEMMQQIGGKETLASKYFSDKPILYNNIEYMAFFNDYFKNYFSLGLALKYNQDVINAINKEKSYASLIRIMRSDSVIIDNAELRELVLLKGLYEIYNRPGYEKEGIKEILTFVRDKGQIPEHKPIAASMLDKLTRFERGMKPKDFSLVGFDNTSVSLENYKGKFVYLLFWASWCTPCLSELSLMQTFHETYSDYFAFIGIMTDGNEASMRRIASIYGYTFPLLNAAKKPEIADNFGVISHPTGVLIDPDGNFIDNPARLPSRNLEALIRYAYILKKENEASKTPNTFNKLWKDP